MPRPSNIPPDEHLLFFPTLAFQPAPATWRIPIHGWIYRPTELSRLRSAALHLATRLVRRRITSTRSHLPLFTERFAAFLADNQRGHRIVLELAGRLFTLKKSHPDGHFHDLLQLPDTHLQTLLPAPLSSAGHWLNFHALTSPADPRTFPGRTLLLPPTGLSIISDIDDTLKISQVTSRRRLVRNTFLRDFACVPGMPALFQHWAATRSAAFHYVSASPWHLYPFLAQFLDARGFPPGTFHLRKFRLIGKDLPAALRSPSRTKARHIRELLRRFPNRRFILVGDSGESDPSTYARLARRFPAQIEKILIRDITADPPNSPRWQKTFRHLPPTQWQIFTTPTQLLP